MVVVVLMVLLPCLGFVWGDGGAWRTHSKATRSERRPLAGVHSFGVTMEAASSVCDHDDKGFLLLRGGGNTHTVTPPFLTLRRSDRSAQTSSAHRLCSCETSI